MERQIINTDRALAAIGPYCQGVVIGGFLFASGQIPLAAVSGEIVSGGIAAQSRQVLESMKAIAAAAGSQMSKVVNVMIYVVDVQQFATLNQIYGTCFSSPLLAHACVEVSTLPKGVEVEMDAIASLI